MKIETKRKKQLAARVEESAGSNERARYRIIDPWRSFFPLDHGWKVLRSLAKSRAVVCIIKHSALALEQSLVESAKVGDTERVSAWKKNRKNERVGVGCDRDVATLGSEKERKREREAVTPSASRFFRLAQNASRAFTAVFSSGSTLRLSLFLSLSCLPLSVSLSSTASRSVSLSGSLPSLPRADRLSRSLYLSVSRPFLSVDTFPSHF